MIPVSHNPAAPGAARPVQPTQAARKPATPAVQQTNVQSINNGWPAPEQAAIYHWTAAEIAHVFGPKG